jgi:hypothetical protein
MNRAILFLTIIAALLLTAWVCETVVFAMSPPKQKTVTQNKPEPNQAKAAEVKPQQPIMEANIPSAKPAEPNMPVVSKVEGPALSKVEGPEAKLVEPDTKTPVITEPAQKSAESKIVEPNKQTESKTAQELCNKCTDLLSRYVDKDGFINYRMLLRKKIELLDILDSFKNLKRSDYQSWSGDEKIAFWINAYNLELIKIILDNYPIESNRFLRLFWPPNSIRHINGIWDAHKFIIMDEEFTLQTIESRYFAGEFDEPRVFLAIFSASVSGPSLKNHAYTGKDLSAQLDEQVKKFLARPHAFKVNRDASVVSISSILSPSWQGSKFIGKYGTDLKFKSQEPAVRAILNFLTKYISQSEIDYLETGNYSIEYINYDWSLNDHSGPPVSKI